MHRPEVRLFVFVVLVAFAAPSLSTAALAQDEPPAKWDQERVTAYAKELEVATDALVTALDAMPPTREPGTTDAFFKARDHVRLMGHAARGLTRQLEAGEGRTETKPRFQRIQLLRRDAEEDGRNAMIPDAVFAKITPVGTALIKLAPYYR